MPIRNIYPALLLFGLLTGCQKLFPDYQTRTAYFRNSQPAVQPDSLLTCVTYNIQLGFRANQNPWNAAERGGSAAQLDSLANLLRRVRPDIICLQEVPRNRSNVDTPDVVEQLAARLRMNYAFGAHGVNEVTGLKGARGEWGNAVLSRFPIEAIDNHEIEYVSKWQRRSMLEADLRVGTRRVRVYSLHFQPSAAANPTVTAAAVGYCRARTDGPQLVLGDFNMEAAPQFTAAGYADVLAAGLYPYASIDRLYCSAGRFTTRAAGHIADSYGTSDHLAMYARLRLR